MTATETEPAEKRPSRFAALDTLRVRDFRMLWVNALSFFIGRGMQMVTVSWLVLELTDSPSLVGVALFAQGIPLALFSIPSGVIADRLDRRKLLIASQAASTLVTAAMAALVLLDVIETWHVLALAFAGGTAMALGQPSRQALVPSLVGPERLMNAIVLNNLVQNLSFIIGPAFAGGLLAAFGFEGAFLVQAALLAAGLPWLLAMRSPPVERREHGASALMEVREGLAHIAASPFLRSLFVTSAFIGVFFVGSFQALVPVFARDVLDVGEVGLGMLSAFVGAGMFTGSLFIASRGNFARKGDVLLRSLLSGSFVFLVFAASPWFPLSLAAMVVWGFGAAFFMNLTMTLIQSNTPDRLMGRVMSVQALAFYGMSPIGNLLAGGIAEVASAPIAAAVGALAVGAMALGYFMRQPALRAAT